jgi:activator of HSP90 ATPase
MFGGSIEGTFTALKPHSELEMDWRFSSWPDGSLSKVKITLDEAEKGSVTLTLKQTGIPDTDRFGNHDVVNMTQAGRKQQVFSRMKQVFGYGM